jgi:hypothetical protein
LNHIHIYGYFSLLNGRSNMKFFYKKRFSTNIKGLYPKVCIQSVNTVDEIQSDEESLFYVLQYEIHIT